VYLLQGRKLNTLDIIILAVILSLAYLGFRRGFLLSIFSLISIIAGLVLATKFHSGVALVLTKVIKDEKTLNVISFLLIFFVIYSAGIFLASKLSKLSRFTKSFDKILGLALGLIKGLLVASLFVIFMKSFSIMGENSYRQSMLYPYVSHFAPDTFDTVSKILSFNKKSFEDLNTFFKN
jgi:membrane protein required for colicin V production